MCKILHLINGDYYAGAERVQDLLALALPRYGYSVSFACLKDGIFDASRQSSSSPLFKVAMRRKSDLRVVSTINKIVKENEYKLIHTHTPRSALIGQLVSLSSGVPMVHHVHGPTTKDTEQFYRNYRNSIVERICVLKASRVIAVSKYAGEYAKSIGIKDNILRMVWNGVQTPRETKKYSSGKVFVIGTVALFRPRKGVEVLLEAVAKLSNLTNNRIKLLMVGDFETSFYENKIKSLAANYGIVDQIEWVGFTTDVNSMLKNMDVFDLPSVYGEGLPMVILEAMAMGVPVVATLVGGIVEAITDKRHGLLVKPGDSNAMCLALNDLMKSQDMRKKLGEEARCRQIKYFSENSMADGVAKVYDELLRGS